MNFVAFERAKQGTGASRRLRNSGKTPGIVYGGSAEPQMIELDHNALWHALKKEAFHSSVLDMEVAGKTDKVLLRDVQYHPFKQCVLHIDFQRVDDKTRLHMKVPLHYSGSEESNAVKVDKCMVNLIVNELDVTCMPSDLPEFIAVDLSKLEKGTSLHLKDIKLPRGVTPVIRGGQHNPALVSVVPPVVVLEAPVADAAPAPVAEAKGKGKAAKPAATAKPAAAAAKPAAAKPAAKPKAKK
ncbi:50S ribosomal protein L25/general stress protein Ctc [Verminephrobacter eiseniae]|uniref:50S ribosomal protein L25/general stress protein Ctc n=1 Tax=Verminephrobacter eiseniae TaxID=364317 RepID=UPI0010F23436|nr:50S ribosomal protein L25/general stress protein Ctc [Verminephrobacter eiseniae]KAB7632548.1 50S ribosomal protein L25/general stress protein Ctc [Verminephrobacter sp. Larva24]MCW5233802.1 50S ribosomal protein L25/general stress protein Ctc [Verminephrobacter eiseniae]MCW5261927.1 50S ribosomal protein L25/general stress protein Ctc [Verminephrobacter eiseniae]MCW5287084.1 50S ribosomal protein L25/general stress protein Ctc [Verminephrobacter eiseniae]MCW5294644.1 50S ribosomal protein 